MNRMLGMLVLFVITLTPAWAQTNDRGAVRVDVNRPKTPFDCDLPIGRDWYGSTKRCLQELCAGQNVFNEAVFDDAGRRRRNPCYRQSPSEVR